MNRAVSVAVAPSRRPAEALRRWSERVSDEQEPEAVPRLERRVAELLGKPAAAMFPTGTMAQQVALRLHADQRGIRTVAFHPTCHLEVHEHKGYELVHGLHAVLLGQRTSLISLADVQGVVEPYAALLLELPQREIGGVLPDWDDLVAQTSAARDRGAAVHLDGARLWEAQPHYDRPHAEIAALFDSVYVSLYKGLMAPSGALLAGPEKFVAQARLWRDRLGGNTDRNWPMAVGAERGLDELLPRMAEFAARARAVAARLAAIDGVRITPEPPQTALFHVYVDAPADVVRSTLAALSEESGIRLPGYVVASEVPGMSAFELTVNEHFDDVTDTEVADLVAELLTRAR